MKCKNCKYFIKKEKPTCCNENFVYTPDIFPNNIKKNQLGYSDDECYGAYIYVGEEFGCIHFNSKK